MTRTPSLVRRVYDMAALLALLNLIALGGLVVMLTTTGGVNGEKLRAIFAVLRGDNVAQAPKDHPSPTDTTASTKQATGAAAAETDPMAETALDADLLRLESKRIQTELDQRLALNNSILLRVMTERERFHEEQKQKAEREEAGLEERRGEGFQKQLAIYQALTPKVALQNLLGLGEADDAARILLELDARKAKKIVESAKSPDDAKKMRTILQRVREVAPDRSDMQDTDGA